MVNKNSSATNAASDLLVAHANGPELRLEAVSSIAATEPVLQAVRDHLAAHAVGERGIYNAELVVEEIFTNTVRYGFDSQDAHRIAIRIVASPDAIALDFDDDAREFDPTQQSAPPQPESLEKAKIGGLGLMLVRRIAQAIAYRRKNERNLLSITLASH